MNKTIMVTGATGYIGSHICKLLKEHNHTVIGVDLVSRPHTLKFIDYFIHDDYNSDATFLRLRAGGVDSIIHCAGTSLVGPSIADPTIYYVNNVAKTAYLLDEISALENKPSIVFSSSAAVYGHVDGLISEDDIKSPISPYGQSKLMIETMLRDYVKAHSARAIALRYFNACGASNTAELGQEPNATHIIARLLESGRDNKPFTLYGTDYKTADGTCVRDYVHVEDLAIAHLKAIEYADKNDGFTAFNLGSGSGFSNTDIINEVKKVCPDIKIHSGDRRIGDPDRLIADNSLAKHQLEWQPTHTLESIIQSAWKWYTK
jgi:UDP-glucose 4-epimerase